MHELTSGRRYSGRLLDVRSAPLTLTIELDGADEPLSLNLSDATLRAATETSDVRAALAPALGERIEVELRGGGCSSPTADVWYHEPIIEDGEVEYTAPCHLRTVLLRAGLIQS